jgi:4'-phosphopantetheinyl transferase
VSAVEPGWVRGPAAPRAAADEVHVWRIALDPSAAEVAASATLLSPDERERAARFRFDADRRRYTVARAALRRLLGRYLERPPAGLHFDYGAYGKPFLPDAGRLRFNLSHSGELALLGVALGRELGVDVERESDRHADAGVARRFFAPEELAALEPLAADAWRRGFFACWTRKEAYVKALGAGFQVPLDAFAVTIAPDAPARLVAARHDPAELRRWTLASLEPAEGYAGAVAVEGSGWRLERWSFESGPRVDVGG